MTQLYLFLCDERWQGTDIDLNGDGFRLGDGVYLIDSALTRSKLYHRLKWQLVDDAWLLVAPLDDAPKFKGMAPGALAWLRARS